MYLSSNPVNIGPPNLFVPNTTGRGRDYSIGTSSLLALAANLIYYVPFTSPRTGGIVSVSVAVGSASGNLDLGVYSYDGVRLGSSGSTSIVVGNNTWTPSTAIPVAGGQTYFLAVVTPGSATFCRYSSSATLNALAGALQQASTFPLPASATFASHGSNGTIPIFAVTLV